MKHRTANFFHFRDRVKERYNLDIDRENYAVLTNMVIANKSIVSFKESNSRAIHLLKIGDIYLPVVYSNTTKTLVTVLPPDYAKKMLIERYL